MILLPQNRAGIVAVMTYQPPPGQPPQPPYPPQQYPPPQGYPPPPGAFAQQGYPPQQLGYQTPYMTGVRCPKCGDPRSKPVTFTWWGGLIGPKLLSHVKCLTCGTAYNGKTGRYNTTGILIYTLAGLAIVVALMVAAALAGK
jgi:hypothetical protein